jgi:FkbM family methyltransferase
MAGDGPLRENVVARASASDGRVEVLGSVEEVLPMLFAADVLLSTSSTEGMPGSLIEAGMCGLPIVATDVGAVSELVVSPGRLVASGAGQAEIASALSETLRESGSRNAVTASSWAHVVDQWLAVLDRPSRSKWRRAKRTTRRQPRTARRRSGLDLARRVTRKVTAHPANRGRKLNALARLMVWQARKRLRTRDVEVSAYGLRLRLPRAAGSVSNLMYFGEAFEWELINFVRAVLRPGDSVVDAGANIGMFTYATAPLVGDTGHVLALEPLEWAANVISTNAASNGLSCVEVVRSAVGERQGTVEFTADLDVSSHIVWASGASSVSRSTVSVPVAKLDDLVAFEPLLVKLDVEGAETMAINGGAALLGSGRVAVVVAEGHDHALQKMGSSRREMLDKMQLLGFSPQSYDVDDRRLIPARPSGDIIFVHPAFRQLIETRLAESRNAS